MNTKSITTNLFGFTIVEVMVVVSIVVILVVSAIPSFQSFVINNRSANIANRLAHSFRLARAEALNTGLPVIVCSINQGLSSAGIYPSNICNNNATVWNAWLIFTDKNFNNTDNDNEAFKFYEDIPRNTITSNTNTYVKYDSSGFCISGGHTFTINPIGCTGKNARVVEVKPSGSIHVNFADCS